MSSVRTTSHEANVDKGVAARFLGRLTLPVSEDLHLDSHCPRFQSRWTGGGGRGGALILTGNVSTGMWAYSVVCGLLLAEVNVNMLCQLGRTGSSITTMVHASSHRL